MDIEVATPITAEAEVKQYTLVGDDIYIKRYDINNIPEWYKLLIEDLLQQSGTITNIQDLIDYLQSLSDGYAFQIAGLTNKDQVINATLESLSSTLGSAQAAISTLNLTKVDADSAEAISNFVVGAYFTNEAGAWFNQKISTYASDIAANASNYSSLVAVVGDTSARIDSVEMVNATISGWSASASKLITSPSGGITGWSFADGSNMNSEFNIYANTFKVTDGTTGYTPFSISGGNVNFNGKVQFSNVLSAPTINKTWIQTSQPSTGMVTGDTWVDTDDSNKTYTYNGTSWVLNALGAKTYYQASAPTLNLIAGDIWIDSDDNNKTYRWNGSQWDNVSLSVASGNKTYYQTAAPTVGLTAGDIWYDSDDGYKMYRWSGSSWQSVNETTISGDRITTGVINANLITAGTLKVGYLEAEKLDIGYLKTAHGINAIASGFSDNSYASSGNGITNNILNTTFTIPTYVTAGSPIEFNFSTETYVMNATTTDASITFFVKKNGVLVLDIGGGVSTVGRSAIINSNYVAASKVTTVSPGDSIQVLIALTVYNNYASSGIAGYSWKADINNKGSIIP